MGYFNDLQILMEDCDQYNFTFGNIEKIKEMINAKEISGIWVDLRFAQGKNKNNVIKIYDEKNSIVWSVWQVENIGSLFSLSVWEHYKFSSLTIKHIYFEGKQKLEYVFGENNATTEKTKKVQHKNKQKNR